MKITNNTLIQNYQFQKNNRRNDLNFKGISPQSIFFEIFCKESID